MFQTMPMGNTMPIFNPSSSAMPSSCHNAAGQAAAPAATAADIVDAHSVPGIKMDAIIPQVSKALPIALTDSEIQLRKQIATKVLITMGGKIMHFEKDIDPATGTVDVDWTFAPMPTAASTIDDDTRIKSHAIIRVYTEHTTASAAANGGKFSYLLGCEAIDLCALMQHSLNVNMGRVDPHMERDYDFPIQTNFCNTFVLCTVLPLDNVARPGLQQLQAMQQHLDLFRGGIAAYDREEAAAKREKRSPIHTGHMYMPSVLRYETHLLLGC